MPTLWQKLTKRKVTEEVKPMELRFYNPLDLRINSSVKVNTIDIRSLPFYVQAIREVKSQLDGHTAKIAEYDLIARPVGEPAIKKRIRLVPRPDPDSLLTHNIVLLDIIDDFEFDENFNNDMEGNTGELYWPNPDTGTDDQFWRVDDVKTAWKSKTAYLFDEDNSGVVDENEVKYRELTFWDFWRSTKEDDRDVLEFVIISRNENGWFQIWRGKEIDANRIEV